MRLLMSTSILLLALVAGVASAATERKGVTTQLTLVEFADSDGDATSDYIIGTVSANKRKCEAGRTVSIIRRDNGRLIDRTKTSNRGYWAGGGVEGINSIEGKVKVARRVIGSGGNRLVCEPASENFD